MKANNPRSFVIRISSLGLPSGIRVSEFIQQLNPARPGRSIAISFTIIRAQ
jgi:hypothetical protein